MALMPVGTEPRESYEDTQKGEAEYPEDDIRLRELALTQANQPGLTDKSVITRAEAFLSFLKGEDNSQPTPAEGESDGA